MIVAVLMVNKTVSLQEEVFGRKYMVKFAACIFLFRLHKYDQ